MIEFKNVTKIFKTKGKTVKALDHVNLTIEDGDIYGIIGFSGAGKSTLIRMINALETPTEGEVMVDGKSVGRLSFNEMRKERRHIGMIFQQFNLFSTKTVAQNIAYPLQLDHWRKDYQDRRVSTQTNTLRSCPAARSSASASPAHWPLIRRFCSPTKPPARSTRKPPPKCWPCSSV